MRKVRRAHGPADGLQQHQLQPAGADLLVHAHQLQHPRRVEARRGDRQAGALEQCADAPGVGFGEAAATHGEARRQHEAGGNGLAVQPLPVAEPGLDRMSESVSEVQQGPLTLLALVRGHDLRLDLAGATDRLRERRRYAGQQFAEMLLQPGEERGVADQRRP